MKFQKSRWILPLLCTAVCFPVLSYAEGSEAVSVYEGFQYKKYDEESIIITGYVGDEIDLIVPQTIDEKQVVQIGANAFKYLNTITSVELPEGMTCVEEGAFEGCEHLTSVLFPSTLSTIGSNAFMNDISLSSVDLSSGIQQIGANAFYGCESLSDVKLSYGLTHIGRSAFEGCILLPEIAGPETLQVIDENAFKNDISLASVDLSSGIQQLQPNAFYGCENLVDVKLSYGLTYIGNSAFDGCMQLEEISIPETVEVIGTDAFRNSPALLQYGAVNSTIAYVMYPNNKVVITGRGTIADYSNVRNTPWYKYKNQISAIRIGDGIKNVSNNMFSTASNVNDISIGENVSV